DAKPEVAHAWWRAIGDVLRDQKRPAEAIDAYRKAEAAYRQRIEAGSEPFNEWELDGIINSIQLAGGKPGEVADVCRGAIKLMQNAPLLHRRLALALRDQNKPGEANAAFDRAIELYRQAPDLTPTGRYSLVGGVLRDKGDLDGAIAAFRKVLD